jgi:hypothetical protein
MQMRERQQSASIFEFRSQYLGFAPLPHCIIRYNLSVAVHRRMIGDERMKLGTF